MILLRQREFNSKAQKALRKKWEMSQIALDVTPSSKAEMDGLIRDQRSINRGYKTKIGGAPRRYDINNHINDKGKAGYLDLVDGKAKGYYNEYGNVGKAEARKALLETNPAKYGSQDKLDSLVSERIAARKNQQIQDVKQRIQDQRAKSADLAKAAQAPSNSPAKVEKEIPVNKSGVVGKKAAQAPQNLPVKVEKEIPVNKSSVIGKKGAAIGKKLKKVGKWAVPGAIVAGGAVYAGSKLAGKKKNQEENN